MARQAVNSIRIGEDGFATVTAIALCVGLAVVSVALVNVGLNSMRRVSDDIEREAERQVLRSAIVETAAELVDVRGSGLGSRVRNYGTLNVEVVVSNELEKVNVYRASDDQIVAALGALASSRAPEWAAELVAARVEGEAANLSLDAWLGRIDLDPQEKACLRETVTVHASSLDPFAVAGETPPAKDAGIINLRARIVGGRPLDLTREAVMVITGDQQTPLLMLEERTFRTSLIEGCFDEKV